MTSIDAARGTPEKEHGAIKLKNRSDFRKQSVFLRVTVSDGLCFFDFSSDGREFESLGEPFTVKPGVWIGAKVGLFATGSRHGHADYNWVRFGPVERVVQTRARVQ
jgi:hypothetical protein